MDQQTVGLFIGWFFLCLVLTWTGAWRVGNVAHAAGAVLGVLVGVVVLAPARRRPLLGGLLAVLVALDLAAAVVARPLINLSPRMAEEVAYQGYLALDAGRPDEAVGLFRRALGRDERPAWCWYDLGIAYQRLGRLEDAAEAYRHAVDRDRQSDKYRRALAGLQVHQASECMVAGKLEAAVRLSEEAVALDKRYADAWYSLGLARDLLGQGKPALEAYERAAALEPNNPVYRQSAERHRR